MPPFIAVPIAGFVLYVIWVSLRTPWPVRIQVVPNLTPQIVGVPVAQRWRIEEFFSRDLLLDEPITVLAMKTPTGRLHTRVKGNIDAGTRQRIRNLLLDVL